MTPDQIARAAAQQAQAIDIFEAEARKAEADRIATSSEVDTFVTRHTDLDYLRRAMTARDRDARCGPGPDRPRVHGDGAN